MRFDLKISYYMIGKMLTLVDINKCLLVVFLAIQLNILSSQSGRPNFDGSTPVTPDQYNNASDTIDRPALRLRYYDIITLEEGVIFRDTSVRAAAFVSPYYASILPGLNLGSENSSSLSMNYKLKDEYLPFGHYGHDYIFDQTESKHLYEVNRPYWDIHYGIGARIKSSNLSTNFYKNFARNIGLNFKYESHSDDGWPDPFSGNSFKRMSIKFFKKSPSGDQMSYIQYDNPRVREFVKYGAFTTPQSILTSNNSNWKIEAGNKSTWQDSIGKSKIQLISTLKYSNKSFSVSDFSYVPSSTQLIINPVSDSINFMHDYFNIQMNQHLNFTNGNSNINFGIQTGYAESSQSRINTLKEFYIVAQAGYTKSLSSKIMGSFSLNQGITSVKDYTSIRSELKFFNIAQLDGSFGLSYLRRRPTLFQPTFILNSEVLQEEEWSRPHSFDIFANVHYDKTNTSINLGYRAISNLLLRNSIGLLDQLSDSYNSLYVHLEQDLDLGPFKTNHSIFVQSYSDNILGLPQLFYSGDIRFGLPLFKRKLNTVLGVTLNYWPSFDTPEYFPITGEFTNISITDDGDPILLVYPYLSAKVDQFYFFVKGINLPRILSSAQIDNLPDSNSDGLNLVSGFPVQNYRIRFGIKWTLLD